MTRDGLKTRTQQAINAIRVFKDKDYGWSQMEKMLYEILIELDDLDWHTGTPTEEGCYIVYYWDDHNPLGVEYEAMCDVMVQPVFDDDGELECWVNDDRSVRFEADDIIRWQKIEPFEEASE